MYNHNGTEILALCNFDSILLFDKSMWINKSCQESWKHMYEKPPFQSVHVKKFRIKCNYIIVFYTLDFIFFLFLDLFMLCIFQERKTNMK